MAARCGSCAAEVVWAKTTTGASMPLDATPTPDGNVAAHRNDQGELIARVLKAGDEVAPWEHRGTSHFSDLRGRRQAPEEEAMNGLDGVSRDSLDRIERAIDPESLTFAQRGRLNAVALGQALRPDAPLDEVLRFAEWVVGGEHRG